MTGFELLGLVLLFTCLWYFFLVKNRLPLPPGPKRFPLIGSLLDMPRAFEWETYMKWGAKHNSDIIYADVAGMNLIILNSYKASIDLLEKRASIYSNRLESTMANDLMGWDWLLVLIPYNDKWKERRRLFHQHMHPSNTDIHQSREVKYTKVFLRQLQLSPQDFMKHVRHMVGAITISMAYGIDALPVNDPYVNLAETAISSLIRALVPGTFLVDVFPLLKYVPSWFPGAGFQIKAAEWRQQASDMLEFPLKEAQRKLAEGIAEPSFASLALEDIDHELPGAEHQLEIVRDTLGQVFAGGADTTVSALNTFFLAMTLYPEVQKVAQEELDRVVQNRLPDYNDIIYLPYISAVLKEVLRWKPVNRLGIPHFVSVEDEYRGFRIPANSVVIGNAWAILQNEEDYPEPTVFNPGRFLENGKLKEDVLQPEEAAFGFGRRHCPGKHVATSIMWLTIASVLSVFEISKARDENDVIIEPSGQYLPGIVSHPAPFKCSIKPRSKEINLIIQTAGNEE